MEAIGDSGVPLLMISGKYDRIVNIEENRRRSKQLSNLIEHIELEEGDHLSFLVGKDMGYMSKVLEYLSKYDGIQNEEF